MKKSSKVLVAVLLVSTLELVLIKPLIPAFFGMTPMWQVLYVVVLYGFPLLVLLPILLVSLPFALFGRQGKGFGESWMFVSQKMYLFISVFILLVNTLVVFAKYATDIPVFPLVKYADIQGTDASLDDLKEGVFQSRFAHIKRSKDTQIETYFRDQKRVEYSLQWLSDSEYRLISQGQPIGMSDTVDVKVTGNFADYYECYVRFGAYTEKQRIEKVKAKKGK